LHSSANILMIDSRRIFWAERVAFMNKKSFQNVGSGNRVGDA